MLMFLAIIHLCIGFGLMFFVLLQDPKGGAMGVFSGGGSSNSFFGASGASNFLTKVTKWLAILFAASCLNLSYYTTQRGQSVMDTFTPPAGSAGAAKAPTEPTPGQPTTPAAGDASKPDTNTAPAAK